MAKQKKEKKQPEGEQKAREQRILREEPREVNKGRDDGNPDWWKNEGQKPGEVH
jgi:hypothetical protein